MKVLIDTNIILDYLLEREPFREDAESLFMAIALRQITGYVTATTLTDIFYIAYKQTRNIQLAKEAIAKILAIMEICPVNRKVIESAFNFDLNDFEDAVQIFCAINDNLDAIVTRDLRGFSSSPIPVFSISKLLEKIN